MEEASENVHRDSSFSIIKDEQERAKVNNKMFAMVSLRDGSSSLPCYSLLIKGPYFYGRQHQSDQIGQQLHLTRVEVDLRTFVIYGIGGTGKRALAEAFDQQRSSMRYDATLWIRSQTRAVIRASFFDIFPVVGFTLIDGAAEGDSNIPKIRNWLSTSRENSSLSLSNSG